VHSSRSTRSWNIWSGSKCASFVKCTYCQKSTVCFLCVSAYCIRNCLFLLLRDRKSAFLNREARGLRWLNAARNVRGTTSNWKCSIWADQDWFRTEFCCGSSILFIKSKLIFLDRSLQGFSMRRDATSSKRFRCFNHSFPVSWLMFFVSHTSLIVTVLARVPMTWKKRVLWTVSAS
jgi:hypothetical protein